MKFNNLKIDRGVSPVIGIVILLGFIVFIGVGLFLFTQSVLVTEEPRVDTDFELQYVTNESFDLVYVNGDDFDSSNTHELYLMGETPDGESIEKTMIYEENNVTNSPRGGGTLSEGMIALTNDDINYQSENESIPSGSFLQIIWEPVNQENEQFVVDEVVIPSEATIEEIVVQDGEFGGNVSINISVS